MQPDVTYDAVIVLTGMVEVLPKQLDESISATSFSSAVDRALAGFAVYRSGKARDILISGGDAVILGRSSPYGEASAVATEMRRWGVPADRIIVETQSRNTHENAVESARIVREHGWTRVLLVTSAFHMKRAAGCFRKEGVTFDMLPVDFRQDFTSPFENVYWPSTTRLNDTELSTREYLGRLIYRLRGYSID